MACLGLIKALRANKNDEYSVIEHALDECRKEIKQSDIDLKAAAVLKLVYVSPIRGRRMGTRGGSRLTRSRWMARWFSLRCWGTA